MANTRRAREVLAVLARSGQFLPVCLTFGPTNGPEDFAFATDRVFAPGRGRKMRFCSNWQIYADDITVRSGRWLDGAYYSDEEKSARVKDAVQREKEALAPPFHYTRMRSAKVLRAAWPFATVEAASLWRIHWSRLWRS